MAGGRGEALAEAAAEADTADNHPSLPRNLTFGGHGCSMTPGRAPPSVVAPA
jgi:hypothetical protein